MKTGRVVKDVETSAGLRDWKRVYVPPRMKMNYKNIMKIGVKKEEASIQFYADLAEMTSDNHSKEILLALAHEEAVHKERFQKALDFLSHIA
jgi:rubrerythrin